MFATLRVDDEVAFGPENLKIPKAEIHQRVEDALETVGLSRFRHHLVWALSGGQIQKLGFASVLAMQPPLMILDEPTANLDPATTHAVHELI
jgi:energy-coupling factor transporter ATP-binding protein EcfA2